MLNATKVRRKKLINSFTAKGNRPVRYLQLFRSKVAERSFMGQNAKATDFLKECMADALIQKMQEKPFEKVTVNEIADLAGVNRSTWFRNFKRKTMPSLLRLSFSGTDTEMTNGLSSEKYTLDNARDFSHLLMRTVSCCSLRIPPRFNPLSMMVSIRLWCHNMTGLPMNVIVDAFILTPFSDYWMNGSREIFLNRLQIFQQYFIK